MAKLRVFNFLPYLALLTLLCSLITSCSPSQSKKLYSVSDIQNLIKTYESYSINSYWLYSCPSIPLTLIKGNAWVDSHKQNYIFSNSYNNVTTLLLVYKQKLYAPLDAHPLKALPLSAEASKKRISSDMFANDPLIIASSYPLTLRFKNRKTLRAQLPSPQFRDSFIGKENLFKTPRTEINVFFDSSGLLDKLDFTRPLGSPGCSERIIFDFNSINRTSVTRAILITKSLKNNL